MCQIWLMLVILSVISRDCGHHSEDTLYVHLFNSATSEDPLTLAAEVRTESLSGRDTWHIYCLPFVVFDFYLFVYHMYVLLCQFLKKKM